MLSICHFVRGSVIENWWHWLCTAASFVNAQRALHSFTKLVETMAKLKPLADRVVVKPNQADEKTASGLFIPDTAKEKPMQGTVVAVGPGKVENGTLIAMTVKEGDHVLYGKYAGTELSLDGEDVLVMRESDLLGIVG